MPATLSTISALMKEVYEGNIVEQLNNATVAYNRIQRTSKGVSSDVGGKYVVFPIHTRRNNGIGARLELEQLPDAGQQGYNSGRVGLHYLYGRVRLSGQTFELASSNAQAFAQTMTQEMQGLKNDLQKDMSRQFYGDGTGKMTTTNATATATTSVTVASSQYLQVGMNVDIWDSTGVTQKTSNNLIVSISGTTVVLTSAVTSAVGDIWVRYGNLNREVQGLAGIVNATTTLFNIAPGTEPLWVASVDNNSGTNRALSEGLMINMIDKIRTYGGSTSVIITSLGVRRAYYNLLSQQRRVVNTQQFTGGFSGLAFTTDTGDVPLISDIDAPAGTMYFLNESDLKFYQTGDWSFMQRDGDVWKWVTDYDAYQALMFKYTEMATFARNHQGVISSITEG